MPFQIHPPTPTAITTLLLAHNLTAAQFTLLLRTATTAKARAHCPYSAFRVGAALLTRSGRVVAGANVENASYPVGTCAERVAFGTAVVEGLLGAGGGGGTTTRGGGGGPEGDDEAGEGGAGAAAGEEEEKGVRAVAVATDGAGPASPCGMCRQFMREFCDLSVPIIMFDKDDNFAVMTLEELLPASFGPEALGAPDPAKQQAGQP